MRGAFDSVQLSMYGQAGGMTENETEWWLLWQVRNTKERIYYKTIIYIYIYMYNIV